MYSPAPFAQSQNLRAMRYSFRAITLGHFDDAAHDCQSIG
jgi:hypothetical protein